MTLVFAPPARASDTRERPAGYSFPLVSSRFPLPACPLRLSDARRGGQMGTAHLKSYLLWLPTPPVRQSGAPSRKAAPRLSFQLRPYSGWLFVCWAAGCLTYLLKRSGKPAPFRRPAFCQALTSLLRPLFFNVSCRYAQH